MVGSEVMDSRRIGLPPVTPRTFESILPNPGGIESEEEYGVS